MNFSNINVNNINSHNINSSNAKINSMIIDKSLNTNGNTNLSNCVFINNNKLGVNISKPSYALDIIGDINYTGNLFNNGIMIDSNYSNYSNTTNTKNTVWCCNASNNHIYYNYHVGIGTFSPKYMLDVSGDSNINGNLIVSKNITCSNLNSTNLINGSTLNIIGDSFLNGDINTNGNINGNNLVLNSNIICSSIICDTYTVSNNSTFFSDVLIDGNVTINGYTDIIGNLNINNNKFTVNATTGDVYVDKSLSVNSSIYITQSMLVNGIVTFTDTLYTNNVQINGNTLTANNTDCAFGNIFSNGFITGKTISIDNANIYSYDNVTFYIAYTTNSTYNSGVLDGALVVDGGVAIGADLNILGNIIGNTTTLQIYTATILNNLNCYSDANISGNLTCSDIVVANYVNSFGININKGGSDISTTCTINTDGNIYTKGTLTIDDLSSFNNDVTIYGNLIVTGTVIVESQYLFKSINNKDSLMVKQLFVDNDNFTINNSTQNVNINYFTASTSSNTGALTIKGGLGVNGNINAGGSIYSNGIITNSLIISYNFFNITDINSNVFFIINDQVIIHNIKTINITSKLNGSFFKFLINYNVIGQVSISLNKNLFGMLINNGKYTSVSGTNTTICLNNTSIGDYVEFYSVQNYFYVKAESSNNNGFIII
jgi:hypothetical protein